MADDAPWTWSGQPLSNTLMPTPEESADLRRQADHAWRLLQYGTAIGGGVGLGAAMGSGIIRGLPWARRMGARMADPSNPLNRELSMRTPWRNLPEAFGYVAPRAAAAGAGSGAGMFLTDTLYHGRPWQDASWRALVGALVGPVAGEPPSWWPRSADTLTGR